MTILPLALLLAFVGIQAQASAPAPPDTARSFRLATVEGRMLRARSIRVDAGHRVQLTDSVELGQDAASQPAALSRELDDLVQIIIESSSPRNGNAGSEPLRPPASASAPGVAPFIAIYPATGGCIRGETLATAARGSLRLRPRGIGPVELPLTALTAVRFAAAPPAAALVEFDARRAAPDKTRDQLIVEANGGVTAFSGSLDQLTPEGWVFRVGERTLRGGFDRAVGVVLAAGLSEKPAIQAVLHAADGDEWRGRLDSADDTGVRFALAGGVPVRIAWAAIARVDLRSGRVLFLSDADPVEEFSQGYFGARWPWRRDRSTAGGTLRIGSRDFAKGVGVHSRSRLAFAVPKGFARFAATLGIDDAGGGRGEVIFRVRGDGRILLDSGPVRANDVPRDISVDVSGVNRIVLEVDFAGDLDLGDHADWANARLLRVD